MWMIGWTNDCTDQVRRISASATVARAPIVARLLGLRLLRFDADVVVLPPPAVLPTCPEVAAGRAHRLSTMDI
jgi:hypothetical protein